MNTQTYLGKGLSLSQLVFALNEELKRAAFLSSVTLDQVSQLDHDATIALTTIREWRNSLARINRLPLDVLSLIPTYLPSQEDHLRASFVCRHWRRTFLQCAKLWSTLFLSKGEAYVKTLLERVKGSPLVVQVGRSDTRNDIPISTMALHSSHTSRIRDLKFALRGWTGIQRFMDINPGPFPLLDSLSFRSTEDIRLGPNDITMPPSMRFFGTAVNLRELLFHSSSDWSPPLSHFVFPNLVVFDFMTLELGFHASQFLDFLEASPMLRTVRTRVNPYTSFNSIPPERVVVLPNVEILDIIVAEGAPCYEIMAHISCPTVTSTSLTFEEDYDAMVVEDIFPTHAVWNTIVQQYARSPLEEVALELNNDTSCTLTLRSSDATVVRLRVLVEAYNETGDELQREVFTEVTTAVLKHPQLANVKRFRICHDYGCVVPTFTPHVANEVGRLFRSLGPLDELTIYHSDIRPYFNSILSIIEDHMGKSVILSPIRDLIVSHPKGSSVEECTTAIVGLAQARHAVGVPFERVIIRALSMPAGVKEGLRLWVGSVEYCHAERHDY